MLLATPLTVLDSMIVFMVKICCWSGSKKITAADLGDNVTLPPVELASLGSKRLVDPDLLKEFATIRSRVRTVLERYGVSFCGGYAVQAENSYMVMEALKACESDFLDAKRRFLADYDKNLADWIAQHEEWRSMLSSSQVSVDVVRDKISFSVQAFQVTPPNDSEIAEGLAQETQGLASQLLREIAKEAQETWKRVFEGKDEVSHRALSPVMAIRTKLNASLYLCPELSPIETLIDETLKSLPGKGYMQGAPVLLLKSLMQVLMDPQRVLEQAAAITSGTSVEEVHKNFLAGSGGGSDSTIEVEATTEASVDVEQEEAPADVIPVTAPTGSATTLSSCGLW